MTYKKGKKTKPFLKMSKLILKELESRKEELKTEQEVFNWLVENQAFCKTLRKSESKFSDGMPLEFISYAINEKGEMLKAENNSTDNPVEDTGKLKVKCIINATNILDSHRDLHVNGIWKNSLKQKQILYLVQEHDLSFKGIISDQVKAYTQIFTFKELGYDYDGDTECLVFDCIIEKERNPFMYEQYKKGYVRNHSVRMQYVKEFFCLDSDDPEHFQFKENHDKYSKMVANKEALTNYKWFYAVIEAKIKDEGSPVVKGSCFATPTLEVTQIKNKLQTEMPFVEKNEPPVSTQEAPEQGSEAQKKWEEFLKR